MTSLDATFATAKIVAEDGEEIRCWLNPTSLQTSRKARFDCKGAIGQSVAPISYMGGDAEALSVALVLHAEDDRTGQDVVSALDALHDLLEPTISMGNGKFRPRTVQLSWGRYLSFVALCESVDVTVELFEADGTPMRALVNLRLAQFKPDPDQTEGESQNPTTRAFGLQRAHTVAQGDSLAALAWVHLRDPTRWREIAEANDIEDPLRLVPGEQLTIPLDAA